MFSVTAFDTVTMKWVVVCRIRITKQTQNAYAMRFRLLFQTCQKEQPRFALGVTLHGGVLDWSDAEANGLRDAVGSDMAEKLLKGCQVHWVRSYQQCAKRVVAKATGKEGKRLEIEAFCVVAAQITKATSQHEVFKLFRGECTLSDVQLHSSNF